MMGLWRMVKLIDGDEEIPVVYVGVYVTRWGKVDEPTVGFVEATVAEMLECAAKLAQP